MNGGGNVADLMDDVISKWSCSYSLVMSLSMGI
jgi:hypothetical protein